MTNTNVKELMHRRNGGIEVALRWHPETNAVSIAVVDDQTGETHACEVPRERALEAFEHPYAYLQLAA